MAALIEPGDEVIIEASRVRPDSISIGFLQANIKWLPRPESLGYQPDLDALRQTMSTHTKLIVLTNLHNPSSAFIEPARPCREVRPAHARAVGARVLVDEVYLDAAFEAEPQSAFHFGNEFVTTNSLTKVYGLSGLRCGWVLRGARAGGEDVAAQRPVQRHSDSRRRACSGIRALERLPELKARTRAILDRNRALVNTFLASRDEVECVPPKFGMTIFPKLNGITVDALCDTLRAQFETTIVPGRFFDQPDHFRLSYGQDTPIVEEGLRRVGQALDELKGLTGLDRLPPPCRCSSTP